MYLGCIDFDDLEVQPPVQRIDETSPLLKQGMYPVDSSDKLAIVMASPMGQAHTTRRQRRPSVTDEVSGYTFGDDIRRTNSIGYTNKMTAYTGL